MSPQWRSWAIMAGVTFVVVIVVNLAFGNGVVPGIGIGLAAVLTSFAVQWLLTRRGRSPQDG
ncbi:hypothetical protein KIH74_08500 [Kineosporia sp. J2-2]|uniref:Uncharacterized protein n=1 Tax=Kineosporia corallincola TaxID=2835133 RepID=A0ABS5TD02_9ACTN|nr:hypothetical protein [Kineosporia corallincola]MBT0768963.1 hypothetical protein [Kineosporia corallincola]